jgi:hypothetical protein
MAERRPWVGKYRWPIYFFVSVAFWNLVGAGLFGFMINPPIALYYMQGLNTTPVHGHAALFGVYGMLGIGLRPFSLRAPDPVAEWKEGLVKFGFWATNIGRWRWSASVCFRSGSCRPGRLSRQAIGTRAARRRHDTLRTVPGRRSHTDLRRRLSAIQVLTGAAGTPLMA